MNNFNYKRINRGKTQLIENIKMLLYNENENIFELLDFENENIYQEPLLYAYFNSSNSEESTLITILFGYIKPDIRPKQLQVKSDDFGRIYFPNLGWIHAERKNQIFVLKCNRKNDFSLFINDDEATFKFEPLEIIKGTNIELLKYSIPLIKQYYSNSDLIDVEIENISRQHLEHLTKAWNLIKELVPKHYELIISTTKKSIIFNIDTSLRNSFASLSVNGVSFSNAYQESYNEVFFVDDIAHQTGHIIFYSLIYEKEDFFKIGANTIIEPFKLKKIFAEKRNIHIVFHALYTYYTTFICLDACLDANVFKGGKKHEALGRMKFYLSKCHHDINLIENNKKYSLGSRDIFTEKGLIIYDTIKNNYISTSEKWKEEVGGFNMSNQPYNFTYSKFIQLNPLKENLC